MSAEPVVAIAPVAAVGIIEQLLPERHQDALFQLFTDDADRALLAIHLEEAAAILANDVQGAAIQSPEEEAKLVALQGRAYKVEKAMEALRKQRLAPVEQERKGVNALLGTESNPGGFLFGQLLARMGKNGDADRRHKAWRAAERARIAREEDEANQRRIAAARQEEEGRARAAAAQTPQLRQAAQQQIATAVVEHQQAELATPLPQVRGVRTEDGKKTFTEVWKFEVVRPQDVPREYLKVDEAAIRAAVCRKDGVREIEGVNIYQDEESRRGV